MATKGRPTLTNTLNSIMPQLQQLDELIVVFDLAFWEETYMATIKRVSHAQKKSPHPDIWTSFCSCRPNAEGHGYQQRTEGMFFAEGRADLICFIDDDDIYLPGALTKMRTSSLEVPTIYRMEYGRDTYASYKGEWLWRTKELKFGNVGTPMFVVPNIQHKLGRWRAHTVINGDEPVGGDFTFINETVEEMGGVIWEDHVTSLVKPS